MIRDNDARTGLLSVPEQAVAVITIGGITWELFESMNMDWQDIESSIESWKEFETTDWW